MSNFEIIFMQYSMLFISVIKLFDLIRRKNLKSKDNNREQSVRLHIGKMLHENIELLD